MQARYRIIFLLYGPTVGRLCWADFGLGRNFFVHNVLIVSDCRRLFLKKKKKKKEYSVYVVFCLCNQIHEEKSFTQKKGTFFMDFYEKLQTKQGLL